MNYYYDPILGLQYTYLGHYTNFGIGVPFKDVILSEIIKDFPSFEIPKDCTIYYKITDYKI